MIPWIWAFTFIGAAFILAAVVFLLGKEERTIVDYSIFVVGLILVALGIIFSEDPLIGYSLFGVGGLLSIISAIKSALG